MVPETTRVRPQFVCASNYRTVTAPMEIQEKILNCRRFCAVKASGFNKSQQLSTSGSQQVQHQSVTNSKFQHISTSIGIWFGTRGSEVQILSPRPLSNAHDLKALQEYPPSAFGLICRLYLTIERI